MALSHKDRQNIRLLERLVHWRLESLNLFEIQRELEARNLPTKGLKPDVSERLRIAIEEQLQHLPAELSKIRTLQIESLEYGRNKDGYNKKGLVGKLKSRNLKISGTKDEMRARLRQAMEKDRAMFDQRARQAAGKSSFTGAVTIENVSKKQHPAPPKPPTAATVPRPYDVARAPARTMLLSPPEIQQQQPVASTPSSLTLEQKQRIEANRKRALELRAAAAQKKAHTNPPTLTHEQKQRIEANRKRALELQAAAAARKKTHTTITP